MEPENFAEHVLEKDTCEINENNLMTYEQTETIRCENENLHKKLSVNEEVLKEMGEKFANLESELEKTKTELAKSKMSCAMMDEQRAEAELSLKTEIKFLISKLTKTKTKLAQNVQKACNSASIENALRVLRSASPRENTQFSPTSETRHTKKSENRYIDGGIMETPGKNQIQNVDQKNSAKKAEQIKYAPLQVSQAQSQNYYYKGQGGYSSTTNKESSGVCRTMPGSISGSAVGTGIKGKKHT